MKIFLASVVEPVAELVLISYIATQSQALVQFSLLRHRLRLLQEYQALRFHYPFAVPVSSACPSEDSVASF